MFMTVGMRCGSNGSTYFGCEGDLACAPSAQNPAERVCVTSPAVGEPCLVVDNNQFCREGSSCRSYDNRCHRNDEPWP